MIHENKTNHIWLMIKKGAVEGRRKALMTLGGWMALCFLIGAWAGYFGAHGGNQEVFLYCILTSMVTAFIASLSFSDMKKKQGRISVLMTPASASDKVIPRILGILVGTILLFITGYVMMEVGRIISCGAFNDEWTSFYIPFKEYMKYEDAGWGIGLFIGSCYMSIAYFFMGGILWPRYSYLISLLLMWFIQMLLGSFLVILPKFDMSFVVTSPDTLIKSFIVTLFIIGTIFFFLTWLRLKHATILTGIFK